jgi:hypothetical protein
LLLRLFEKPEKKRVFQDRVFLKRVLHTHKFGFLQKVTLSENYD